jgi:hypothetical protein
MFQRNLLPPSSTLKTDVAGTFNMLVLFYKTTSCHIPEDSNFNIHHHDNIRSHRGKHKVVTMLNPLKTEFLLNNIVTRVV